MRAVKMIDSAGMGNILGVTSHTVVQMAKKGVIPYGRYSTYGPYRFNPDAVLKSLGLHDDQGSESAYWRELKETNNKLFEANLNLEYKTHDLERKIEKLESTLENIKEVLG